MAINGSASYPPGLFVLDADQYGDLSPDSLAHSKIVCNAACTFNINTAVASWKASGATVDLSPLTTLQGQNVSGGGGGSASALLQLKDGFQPSVPNLTSIIGGNNDLTLGAAGNAELDFGANADGTIAPCTVTTIQSGTDTDTYTGLSAGIANLSVLQFGFFYTVPSFNFSSITTIIAGSSGDGINSTLYITGSGRSENLTTSIDVSGIVTVTGGAGSVGNNAYVGIFDWPHVTSISLSASPTFSDYVVLNFSGNALSSVQSQLQWALTGWTNGGFSAGNPLTASSIDVSGGTNAAPVITPETDVITLTTPNDGDTFTVAYADSSASLQVVYSASIPFASSALVGNVLTVGIQDSPAVGDIGTLVSTNMNNVGFTSFDDGMGNITNNTAVYAQWPMSLTGSDASLVQVQAGIDLVTSLTLIGCSVTHN